MPHPSIESSLSPRPPPPAGATRVPAVVACSEGLSLP